MPVTSEDFRDTLRHFASGVTIVTVKAGDEVHGLTVSAFASISADPPLVAVVIDQRHAAFPLLERADAVFAINVLHQDQTELSDRFAWVKDEDRFLEGAWETASTGAPVLSDALAWLDCTVDARHAAGTHTIYVGEVQAGRAPRPEQPPLVYWNRGYHKLEIAETAAPPPEMDGT